MQTVHIQIENLYNAKNKTTLFIFANFMIVGYNVVMVGILVLILRYDLVEDEAILNTPL